MPKYFLIDAIGEGESPDFAVAIPASSLSSLRSKVDLLRRLKEEDASACRLVFRETDARYYRDNDHQHDRVGVHANKLPASWEPVRVEIQTLHICVDDYEEGYEFRLFWRAYLKHEDITISTMTMTIRMGQLREA